jgi:hypothetical protein
MSGSDRYLVKTVAEWGGFSRQKRKKTARSICPGRKLKAPESTQFAHANRKTTQAH